MLKINWKKLLPIGALGLIYILLAGLTSVYPELKTPILIIFGVNCFLAVTIYIGMKFYNRKKAKHVLTKVEDLYLKSKYGKYDADDVSRYFYFVTLLISVCLLLVGLPLVIAGVL